MALERSEMEFAQAQVSHLAAALVSVLVLVRESVWAMGWMEWWVRLPGPDIFVACRSGPRSSRHRRCRFLQT